MEMIGADIALGGDIKNVVRRDDLTWPELCLMRDIHGDAAVTNIEVVGEHTLPEFDEMARLKAKYGRKFVRVFGRNPSALPLHPPASIPRWDDEVEVQVRRRRDAPLQGNPVFVETEAERRDRALGQQGKVDRPPPRPQLEPDEDDEDEPSIADQAKAEGVSERTMYRRKARESQQTGA